MYDNEIIKNLINGKTLSGVDLGDSELLDGDTCFRADEWSKIAFRALGDIDEEVLLEVLIRQTLTNEEYAEKYPFPNGRRDEVPVYLLTLIDRFVENVLTNGDPYQQIETIHTIYYLAGVLSKDFKEDEPIALNVAVNSFDFKSSTGKYEFTTRNQSKGGYARHAESNYYKELCREWFNEGGHMFTVDKMAMKFVSDGDGIVAFRTAQKWIQGWRKEAKEKRA
jgi:hypothetical protein